MVSPRQYIEDGCFTVFLTYHNDHDAEDIRAWMRDPYRPLFYGRRRYLAAALFDATIIRDSSHSIDDIIATWPPCHIHPIQAGDTCTVNQDTTKPAWMPGVEEHPGHPIDYMTHSRRRATRRTITTTITVRTPQPEPPPGSYNYDFTTGQLTHN